MQLEFDFTFWHMCDLVDNDTGAVIGAACLECYMDYDGWYYLAEWEEADFDFAPYTPYPTGCWSLISQQCA